MNLNREATVFVAGHRGLVGSAILRRLESAGFTNILARSHRELDLTDQGSVREFFRSQKPEYVFLAAAKVGGILANTKFPADFIRENLLIQANVIDAACRWGTKKLLFLGSSCIYPKMAPQPIREEHLLTGPLEPTNEWYAVAKIAGIEMCRAYSRQYGFRAISLMPTNLYGPADNFDLETSHVLPAMIRKFHLAKLAFRGDGDGILRDESVFGSIPDDFRSCLHSLARSGGHGSVLPNPPATLPPPAVILWGTGTPRREFLHVDDLADCCLFLMEHYDSDEIINVGVGEDHTIRDLAGMVSRAVGYDGPIVFDITKPDGTPRKLLDTGRLTALGWTPQISLREGIARTYEWYCSQLRTDGPIPASMKRNHP